MRTLRCINAQKEVFRIRLDGSHPGDEDIKKLVRKNGPKRALELLSFAADFSRTVVTVH